MYSPLESWGKLQLSDPRSAMPSSGENPTPKQGSHETKAGKVHEAQLLSTMLAERRAQQW